MLVDMHGEYALKLQDPFTNLRFGEPITRKNARWAMNDENIHDLYAITWIYILTCTYTYIPLISVWRETSGFREPQ